MPYTPNTCPTNDTESDAVIVAMYPETLIQNPNYDAGVVDDTDLNYYQVATSVAMTMDILAVAGRSSYVITLLDADHGKILSNAIKTDLNNFGYDVNNTASVVTISCS